MDDRQAFRDHMLPPRAQCAQDGIDDRAFQAAPAGERAVELVLTPKQKARRTGAPGRRAPSPTLPTRGTRLGRGDLAAASGRGNVPNVSAIIAVDVARLLVVLPEVERLALIGPLLTAVVARDDG